MALMRTVDNKFLGGVCGGMAKEWNMDPTLVRLIFVLLVLLTGFIPFFLIYIILWVIMPEAPRED